MTRDPVAIDAIALFVQERKGGAFVMVRRFPFTA